MRRSVIAFRDGNLHVRSIKHYISTCFEPENLILQEGAYHVESYMYNVRINHLSFINIHIFFDSSLIYPWLN